MTTLPNSESRRYLLLVELPATTSSNQSTHVVTLVEAPHKAYAVRCHYGIGYTLTKPEEGLTAREIESLEWEWNRWHQGRYTVISYEDALSELPEPWRNPEFRF
jgi:hypothetical protein